MGAADAARARQRQASRDARRDQSRRRAVWLAHQGVQALRAIFDPDLTPAQAEALLDRFLAWAQRFRMASFVKLGRTIRKHRVGILAGLDLGINNGRAEGLNRKARAITRVPYGFYTAKAVAAMILLCCGPSRSPLAHQKPLNQ